KQHQRNEGFDSHDLSCEKTLSAEPPSNQSAHPIGAVKFFDGSIIPLPGLRSRNKGLLSPQPTLERAHV
ncbi:hypothetical protein, partial [Rhizobium sp.]|uniref:hypothetical protein n=1 Tax=Rhizobium sp. TaxID=391 RepID=UPI0028B228AC